MEQRDRVAVAASVAIVVACVVHVVAPLTLAYYPLERAWRVGPPIPGVTMLWYGRSATTLAAALVASVVTYVATGVRRTASPPWLAATLTWITLGCLFVALGFIVQHEWHAWVAR